MRANIMCVSFHLLLMRKYIRVKFAYENHVSYFPFCIFKNKCLYPSGGLSYFVQFFFFWDKIMMKRYTFWNSSTCSELKFLYCKFN